MADKPPQRTGLSESTKVALAALVIGFVLTYSERSTSFDGSCSEINFVALLMGVIGLIWGGRAYLDGAKGATSVENKWLGLLGALFGLLHVFRGAGIVGPCGFDIGV